MKTMRINIMGFNANLKMGKVLIIGKKNSRRTQKIKPKKLVRSLGQAPDKKYWVKWHGLNMHYPYSKRTKLRPISSNLIC